MIEHTTITFKNSKNINKSDDLSGDFVDLLYKTFQIPDEFSYRIVVVTKDTQYRPDLISKALYGTTIYTDVICKLNDVCNPFEMGIGTNLIVPSFNDVVKFSYEDSSLLNKSIDGDSTSSNGSTYTQKTKTETRSANQQITGDSNFRINKDSKIIIY